jgi:hypothetical protein
LFKLSSLEDYYAGLHLYEEQDQRELNIYYLFSKKLLKTFYKNKIDFGHKKIE